MSWVDIIVVILLVLGFIQVSAGGLDLLFFGGQGALAVCQFIKFALQRLNLLGEPVFLAL